jgi:hypothetical protein
MAMHDIPNPVFWAHDHGNPQSDRAEGLLPADLGLGPLHSHNVRVTLLMENGIAATLLEGDGRQLTISIAVVVLTPATAVAIRATLMTWPTEPVCCLQPQRRVRRSITRSSYARLHPRSKHIDRPGLAGPSPGRTAES